MEGLRRLLSNGMQKLSPLLILMDRVHVAIAEGFSIDELDEKIKIGNK